MTVADIKGVYMYVCLGGLRARMCRCMPGGAWVTVSKLHIQPRKRDWCVNGGGCVQVHRV